MKLFAEKGINTDNIIISNKVTTPAYCKPIRKGISEIQYEDPRIDLDVYKRQGWRRRLRWQEEFYIHCCLNQ